MKQPLTPQKARSLIDAFQRHSKDLEVYEGKLLAQAQIKELLKQPNVWMCVGKNKWS